MEDSREAPGAEIGSADPFPPGGRSLPSGASASAARASTSVKSVSERGRKLSGRWHKRGPFPDVHFFKVYLPLYDTGLIRVLSGSATKRFLTLLRLSNYQYGRQEIRIGLKELRDWDGVSDRHAFHVNAKLLEYGLVEIKETRPMTYVLKHPDTLSVPPHKSGPHASRPAEASSEFMPPTYEEVFGK